MQHERAPDARQVAIALAGAAAGVLAVRAFLTEPHRLEVTTHVVRTGGTAAGTARIVQLTDLHLRSMGVLERRVISAVRAARPDLIVITGDSISRRPAMGALHRLLSRLDGVAPGYAVLGNWDRWSGATMRELRRLYERHDIRLLVNETDVMTVHGQRLRVTGVDDLVTGEPSAAAGLDAWTPEETHLLLSHCPGFRERLWRELGERPRQRGWGDGVSPIPALMLAGHTHGGQIRLLGVAPVRPRGSGRYLEGWYRDERPHMYVSRGIGTSAIQARLGSRPEVAVFDVELPLTAR